MTTVVRNLLLLGALALLAFPAGAQASPLRDCTHDNKLDREYSNSELKKALDNLPTDIDEYYNCRELFNAALHDGSDQGGGRPDDGTSGTGSGDDGGALSAEEQTARNRDGEELAAITGDREGHRPSVEVGGETVKPGDNGLFDLASASNDLPTPLLAALIALALLALAGGIVALRGRIPALSRIPLLSKIPTPRVPFLRFRR